MIRPEIRVLYKVNEELAKKWLANGAQPTETVGKIFKMAGIEKVRPVGGVSDERISRSNCKVTGR